jgi:hypothetical protein
MSSGEWFPEIRLNFLRPFVYPRSALTKDVHQVLTTFAKSTRIFDITPKGPEERTNSASHISCLSSSRCRLQVRNHCNDAYQVTGLLARSQFPIL